MKKIYLLVIMGCCFSFISCSTTISEEITSKKLEEKADLFLLNKEYEEAKLLYNLLKSEYKVDIDEKLSKLNEISIEKNNNEKKENEDSTEKEGAKQNAKTEEKKDITIAKKEEANGKNNYKNIQLNDVRVDFNFEKELKKIVKEDPEYGERSEDNLTLVFRYTARYLDDYNKFLKGGETYLNKRVYGRGTIRKVLSSNSKRKEFIVQLYGESSNKLVKIYAEVNENSGTEYFGVGNEFMFHGYYMGLHDYNGKRIPTFKSIITEGVAG